MAARGRSKKGKASYSSSAGNAATSNNGGGTLKRKRGRPSTKNRQPMVADDSASASASASASVSTVGGGNGECSKVVKVKGTIFWWLIKCEIFRPNKRVYCKDEEGRKIKGKITRDGIVCDCCDQVLTASEFCSHATGSSIKAYDNIFIERMNISLIACMKKAWDESEAERACVDQVNTIKDEADLYDDACIICADGGNLLCCQDCTSTYHQSCMDIEVGPDDSWYCPYCVCKFCSDPVRKDDSLLKCVECEKKYHWECHKEREATVIDLNSEPCAPYCDWSCKEVHEKLDKMIGVNNKIDEEYSWTLLHRTKEYSGVEDTYERIVCRSKLAVAYRVMKESFEPIIDRFSRIDVIKHVVYSSSAIFNRINFTNFFTAVLEKNDEIVSVATLRVHGKKLGEMPFIATSEHHRKQSNCPRLMNAIESALKYLSVQNLVIASTDEQKRSWKSKYAFAEVDEILKKEIRLRNTLMFHNSVRLNKPLLLTDSVSSAQTPALSIEDGGGAKPMNFDLNIQADEHITSPSY